MLSVMVEFIDVWDLVTVQFNLSVVVLLSIPTFCLQLYTTKLFLFYICQDSARIVLPL